MVTCFRRSRAAHICFGIRGKVIARGVFCARCGFDLAGLKPRHSSGACPECGQDISSARAVRTIRRARRKPLLIMGVILGLAGIGLAITTSNVTTNSVLAALPTPVVDWAERNGVDGALSVLADRAVADELPASYWDHLIERGFEQQADRNTLWDPRWGDVLARAMYDRRLTNEQIAQYVKQGFLLEVVFREQVAAEARSVPVSVRLRQDRIHTRPNAAFSAWRYSLEPPWYRLSVRQTGLEGVHEAADRGGISTGGPLHIPSGPISGSTLRSAITLRHLSEGHDVATVPVFVELVIDLSESRSDEPFATVRVPRFRKEVVFLPPGIGSVSIRTDHGFDAEIAAATNISELRVESPEKRAESSIWATGEFKIDGYPIAVAGTLYLELEAGEIPIGSLSVGVLRANHWQLDVRPPSAWETGLNRTELARVLDAAVEKGVGDFVFRSEHEPAARTAELTEIGEITIRFRGVPIIPKETKSPQRWYSGEILERDPVPIP